MAIDMLRKRVLITNGIRALLLLCAVTLNEQGNAASFDCAKASTEVERLICANVELSALDSEVGRLFNAMKAKNPNIGAEQKQWLRSQRDICKSEECLKLAYEQRIQTLNAARVCPVEKKTLIANWITIKGDAFFEEMKLSILKNEQHFESWRHNRLEMPGTWTFKDCVLHIRHRDQAKLQFDYEVRNLSKDNLYLVDQDSGAELVYKKAFGPLRNQ